MLVVVDVQNGFMPGGSLPVPEGDQVVPLINRIAPAFRHVIITQDWHTPRHVSFASSHAGKKPLVIRKGYRQHVDSYSAFLEADRTTMTGLSGYLRERGLETGVIEDATRGIDAGGSVARAWQEMARAGVGRVRASDIAM